MTDINDNRTIAYNQLCTSYHAIDDFRAKLLGFLPLVTGGGLVLLTGRPEDVRQDFFTPVGIFGVAVTIGLLAYELNGVRRCRELIDEGRALETDMQLVNGQFISRRDPAFSIVTKPFAAAWIYPAVLAAWTYLALFVNHRDLGKVLSPIVLVAGLAAILLYDQWLQRKARRTQAAKKATDPGHPAKRISTPPPVARRFHEERE